MIWKYEIRNNVIIIYVIYENVSKYNKNDNNIMCVM